MRKLPILLVPFFLAVIVLPVHALNIDKVKIAFLNQDYKAAIAEGEKIVARTSSHAHGVDELYYLLGLCYMKDDNLLRASDIFEIILKEYKRSDFREEAMMGLGDTYLLKHDYAGAAKVYNELLRQNPNSRLKSQVLYRLSQAGFKEGKLEEGKVYLGKLATEAPQNVELKQAREAGVISDDISNLFYSVQVGAFSKKENAQNLVARLCAKEYPAYLEENASTPKARYRVKVGRFKEKADAEALRRKLVKDGYPTKLSP